MAGKSVCVLLMRLKAHFIWRSRDTKSHVDALWTLCAETLPLTLMCRSTHILITATSHPLMKPSLRTLNTKWARFEAVFMLMSRKVDGQQHGSSLLASLRCRCPSCKVPYHSEPSAPSFALFSIFAAQGSVCHQQAVAVMLYCLLT